MKACIINIGDEILIGQVVNTNAAWLASKFNQQGISVEKVIVIGDDEEDIVNALEEAQKIATVTIITGGLGPTKDDVTKRTLANYFDKDLVFHQPTFENMQKLLAQFGKKADGRYKQQAKMPGGAKILINKTGTASGMWFEETGKVFVSLPGVPREVKYLMKYEVLPRLHQQFMTPTILHRTILTIGKGETDLSEILHDFEANLPSNLKLAYLPDTSTGILRLRLTAIGEDDLLLETQLAEQIGNLQEILGTLIFGEHKETLASVVGRMLLARRWTLGTAESCTGGNIAHRITSIPGSSNYYPGSVIAYSNQVKMELLNVKESTLEEGGAVSEQCVIEMARGTQKLLGVDCAIAVSGVAGPGGGSPEKPVGTIWVAVAKQEEMFTKKLQLSKDRIRNIELTSSHALNLLRRFLINDLEV